MSSFKQRVSAIIEECERIKNLAEISSTLWKIETDVYETQDDILDFTYFDGRFPYHIALYPLLDYVYTFSNVSSLERLNSPGNDSRRLPSLVFDSKRRVDRELELKIPGYCPCSAYSIFMSLVPIHRAHQGREVMKDDTHQITLSENEPRSTYFSFLDEWSREIVNDEWKVEVEKYVMNSHQPSDSNEKHSVFFKDGPENIEPDKLFDVLSRLLKHSLSPMQRDHRLARSVLLLMIEYKCLNDEENLRNLLVILTSDNQQCDSNCHADYIEKFGFPYEDETEELPAEFPQHYCNDFQNFRQTVSLVLAYGMDYLSDVAMNILLAFLNMQINPFAASKIGGPIPYDEWREDIDGIPLIKEVIGALHSHGCKAKHKLVILFRRKFSSSSSDDYGHDAHITRISDSYGNCIRCLAYIGETFILRLEPSYMVAMLGGLVVKALVTVLNSEYIPFEAFSGTQYIGSYDGVGRNFPTLLSFNRYSDLISVASTVPEMRLRDAQDLLSCTNPQKLKDNSIVLKVFLSPVTNEVATVVRGLYLRNLVDMTSSCCGYGDFLVWSKQSISSHDKLLYYHELNFPDSDEDIEQGLWGRLDEGPALRFTEIVARYDFSLLALKSAWHKPWSFTSHKSFSSSFHQAIWTFSLCANRKRLPADLLPSIFEFIPRVWFLDGQVCWVAQCQIRHLNDDIKGIATQHNVTVLCPNCHIACACSTQHALDILYKEGHKRICGLGPLHRYGCLEEAFCKQITSHASSDEISISEDQGSDASSWESINSEQEERLNSLDDCTRQMISFFAKDHKLYFEDLEFENFLRIRNGDY